MKSLNLIKILTILAIFFAKPAFSLHAIKPNFEKSDDSKLEIYNRILVDNVNSKTYSATDRKDEYKNSFARFDLVTNVKYDKNWFLYFNYRVQEDPSQISEVSRRNNLPNGGGDKSYENHFGLARELYFGYENDNFKVYGGKFRPAFGRAWLLGRGIWTQDLSVNYMQLERLGLGAILKAGDKKTTGRYNFGFSSYTQDTKNLDNSQITTRDPALKSEGLAGQERGFNSYNAHMDINFDFGKKEKIFYRLAYSRLGANNRQAISTISGNKIEDQKGLSATIIYNYPLSNKIEASNLVEYVDLKNINGNSDLTDQYFNINTILTYNKNWNITLGVANQKRINHSENGFDRQESEISAGYTFFKTAFFDKFQLQFGHKHERSDNKINVRKRNIYGLMLRYIKWF